MAPVDAHMLLMGIWAMTQFYAHSALQVPAAQARPAELDAGPGQRGARDHGAGATVVRDRSALILTPHLRGDDENKQVGIRVCALARALRYLTNRSDWLVRMQSRALETFHVKPPSHANGAQLTPAVRER